MTSSQLAPSSSGAFCFPPLTCNGWREIILGYVGLFVRTLTSHLLKLLLEARQPSFPSLTGRASSLLQVGERGGAACRSALAGSPLTIATTSTLEAARRLA